MPDQPRVVVVGAGFGGIDVARGLRRAPVRTLLIDRHNYHLFTPLCYQVASALLDPSEVARPVRAMIRRLSNVEFRLGSVRAVDLDRRTVSAGSDVIAYEFLVLACGSRTNYFGNAAIQASAYGLKDLGQALALRNRILAQFERAAWTGDAAIRRKLLSFVIVGGGPTGVEYAGALSELIGLVLRKDFPRLDLAAVKITLVEAADHPLDAFAPQLRAAAVRTLRHKGIEVLFDAQVEDVKEGRMRLADGRELPAGTVVWTAGVRGDPPAGLESFAGRSGRLGVKPSLQLPGHPEVFVIGDAAELEQAGSRLPQVIPVAQQGARHVAASIQQQLRGEAVAPFLFRDPGMMATIGRNSGVAQIGRLQLSGLLGWMVWLAFHLLKVVSFRNRVVVLVNWAVEYFFYDRPVRLISAPDPELEPSLTTESERR